MPRRYLHARHLTETISDDEAPVDNDSTLVGLIGWVANRLKAATGNDSWRTPPDATLKESRAHFDSRDNPHAITAAQAGAPPTARSISTTAPLSGGGSLAANRTLDISDATPQARGAMSAPDKARLDGMESGATADQSDAEIQAAVQRTDGAGSGLDADTVDGLHGNAFSRTSHRHDDIYAAGDPSGASSGQVWTYDSAAGGWRPRSLPPGGVTSVYGRTGAVSAQSGDYSASQVGAAPSSHVGSGGSAHPAATSSASGFITPSEKSKLASVNVIDASFRCELTRDSDISFANGTWTAIPWNVETLDPRGWHDNATNPTRISPGTAGTYLVQFYMAWRSGSGTREHMVGMNGSHMPPRNRVDCAVNPNGTMSSVFIVNLTAASDYIELFAKQDSGGNLNLFGASNTVIVARIL